LQKNTLLIQQNYSLKTLNTFGLDVQTQQYAKVTSAQELADLYASRKLRPVKKLILGGGSNVLFTRNWLGLVVHIGISGIEVIDTSDERVLVSVGAGEIWHQLVLWAVERGYGGLENLSLIPGTVGAAPMQNIGAYGVELKDVFHSLEAFDIKTGKVVRFYKEDCSFDYRHSVFKGELKGKFVITRVNLSLTRKPELNISYGAIRATLEEKGVAKPTIRDVSNAVIHIRQSKLPDPAETGNAGSFFKNPVIEKPHFEALEALYPEIPHYQLTEDIYKIPAGWLIETCGWKGYREGHMGVHDRQALVLVNYGGANGMDIKKLSDRIKKSVQDTFQIDLEREVNLV